MIVTNRTLYIYIKYYIILYIIYFIQSTDCVLNRCWQVAGSTIKMTSDTTSLKTIFVKADLAIKLRVNFAYKRKLPLPV